MFLSKTGRVYWEHRILNQNSLAGSESRFTEFALQLLIAIALSVPLTLWLTSNWLDNFADRTDIGVGLFVVSALAAMLIAGVVIMYHTLRAAKINPVQSLRVE